MSNYEDSSSKEVKSNPKTFFAYAKSKLNYASSIPDQSYKIIKTSVIQDGSKIITSNECKATIFNSFLKNAFMKEKNTVPDFERVCEANISKVVFSEDKVKKKSEILISHLRKTIYIREY